MLLSSHEERESQDGANYRRHLSRWRLRGPLAIACKDRIAVRLLLGLLLQYLQSGPSGRGQPFVDIAVSVVPLYKKIMLWQNFSVHQMGHPIIMLVHFINHTRL